MKPDILWFLMGVCMLVLGIYTTRTEVSIMGATYIWISYKEVEK